LLVDSLYATVYFENILALNTETWALRKKTKEKIQTIDITFLRITEGKT
jgi:hypothetical protein